MQRKTMDRLLRELGKHAKTAREALQKQDRKTFFEALTLIENITDDTTSVTEFPTDEDVGNDAEG